MGRPPGQLCAANLVRERILHRRVRPRHLQLELAAGLPLTAGACFNCLSFAGTSTLCINPTAPPPTMPRVLWFRHGDTSTAEVPGDVARQIDPELEGPVLPSKNEEFRPFVRRLPEFKFWCASHTGCMYANRLLLFTCHFTSDLRVDPVIPHPMFAGTACVPALYPCQHRLTTTVNYCAGTRPAKHFA